MGDALLALETMLAGIRPHPRPIRKLQPAARQGFASPMADPPDIQFPDCEPVWIASLGLSFKVTGIDSGSTSVAAGPAAEPLAAGIASAACITTPPVSHRQIPSRRPARPLPALCAFETGSDRLPGPDRLIDPPVVSPPRLRIHLPNPSLSPFRPRYAFSPRPVEENPHSERTEPPVAVEKQIEKPADSRPQKSAADRDERKKQRKNSRGAAESNDRKEPLTASTARTAPIVESRKPEASPLRQTANDAQGQKEERPGNGAAANAAAPESFKAPSFGGNSEPDPEGFWNRMPGWLKAAAALVIVAIVVGGWAVPALSRGNARTGTLPSGAAPAPTAMGAESWETSASGDTAGIARRRVISLYKPGRTKRDYIFEFAGHIEQRAMGWVFRMKDARNYYCLKLEKTGDGAGATARLVKFAVVDGEEQPHRLVELREILPPGVPVKIRLDVRGQNFSTQVNGKHVDVWIDNQLASGTVGFSNESGERAVIRTVKVSY
jgi:hypothetical protein